MNKYHIIYLIFSIFSIFSIFGLAAFILFFTHRREGYDGSRWRPSTQPATQSPKQLIPKIIHQTYSSRDIPSIFHAPIKKLKDMNPEYEYRFYTDDDIDKYIELYYPDVYPYFKRINPKYGPARSDIFRYHVLYNIGGVWSDFDVIWLKPMSYMSTITNRDDFNLSFTDRDIICRRWGLEMVI